MGNVGVQTTAGHAGIFFVYGGALKEHRCAGICMILFLFFPLPHLQIHVRHSRNELTLKPPKDSCKRR